MYGESLNLPLKPKIKSSHGNGIKSDIGLFLTLANEHQNIKFNSNTH